jgi:hypothetical protein
MATVTAKASLLNTWKEIATYLGRGVRTAQRWEEFGLPVRRMNPGPRASVLADAHDIDNWLRSSQIDAEKRADLRFGDELRTKLFNNLETMRALGSENRTLREGSAVSLSLLISNIQKLKTNFR